MGGSAFPNHNTPRLTHDQYQALLRTTIARLQPFYSHIIAPPEAPSKPDHGDVDLLVSGPRCAFTADDLATTLDAVDRTKEGITTSFCVPLPTPAAAGDCSAAENAVDGTPNGIHQQLFAQVDIHVVPTHPPSLLQWTLFQSSYGDLSQILGVLQRPLGLTANDKGLNVRIPEIEARGNNRKKAMMFLTDDPAQMCEFFGLDYGCWERGWASDEAIFEWCLRGRLWGEGVIEDVLEGKMRVRDGETGGKGMHSGDRQRMRKRGMFRAFVEGFVPAHEELWKGKRDWTREEVLDEALGFFDKKTAYEEMMGEFRSFEREKAILEEIKRVIPLEGERLGQCLKGLNRWVVWQEGTPVMCEDERDIGDRLKWLAQVKDQEKEKLLDWVKSNYEILRIKEKERVARLKEERQSSRTQPPG